MVPFHWYPVDRILSLQSAPSKLEFHQAASPTALRPNWASADGHVGNVPDICPAQTLLGLVLVSASAFLGKIHSNSCDSVISLSAPGSQAHQHAANSHERDRWAEGAHNFFVHLCKTQNFIFYTKRKLPGHKGNSNLQASKAAYFFAALSDFSATSKPEWHQDASLDGTSGL